MQSLAIDLSSPSLNKLFDIFWGTYHIKICWYTENSLHVEDCSFKLEPFHFLLKQLCLFSFILWIAPGTGKMNQILCCDWLREWENGAIFFPRDYPLCLATKYTQQLRKATFILSFNLDIPRYKFTILRLFNILPYIYISNKQADSPLVWAPCKITIVCYESKELTDGAAHQCLYVISQAIRFKQ